jgi:predicted Zn-dependent protease
MTATNAAPSEHATNAEQGYQRARELTLQLAVGHHEAGRMPEAEQLYRAILQGEPAQPQANHNLGILLLQAGQPAAALPHLEAALAAKPESERYWLSYIDALAQDGQSALARERLAFARGHGLAGEAVEALAARLHAAWTPPEAAGADPRPGA